MEKEGRIPEFLRTEEFIEARFKEISVLSNMTGKCLTIPLI